MNSTTPEIAEGTQPQTGNANLRQAMSERLKGVRLLIVNWTRRRIGGTEDYLDSIIQELHPLGFKLAFASEDDTESERSQIDLPSGVPAWSVDKLGQTTTIGILRTWKPDLIYAHGELKVDFEQQLLKIAPAIYFAHNYYGTCISGYKAHKFPIARPCSRMLGPRCLINYLPLRCGGRSPITMVRRYVNERNRIQNLKNYVGIVTHSEHMRQEYIRHGIPTEKLFSFAYEVGSTKPLAPPLETLVNIAGLGARSLPSGTKPNRLLFLGRMDKLKGGRRLIESASIVHNLLKSPVHITFAGDGPERELWQKLARKAQFQCPDLSFSFPGWLSKDHVYWSFENTDVLVVPSLWPEPFGRVGLQAGQHGVPVAAFAVGGIPEWLKDGQNGKLADGNPPTAEGLAHAIAACLDKASNPALRTGARELATRFSTEAHIARLLAVFESALAA